MVNYIKDKQLVGHECIKCSKFFATLLVKKGEEYNFCCPYCQTKARFSSLSGTHWINYN